MFGKIEGRNPRSTFKERNLYTVLDEGQPSDVVEREYYGGIDDRLAWLLGEVEAVFARGHVPRFDRSSMEAVRDLILALMVRVPEFHGRSALSWLTAKYECDALELISSGVYLDEDVQLMRTHLGDRTSSRSLVRDIMVRATCAPNSDRVQKALQRFDVRWVDAPQRSSFVLSSRMIVRVGNKVSTGVESDTAEFWLPVSPRRAMVMLPDLGGRVPKHQTVSQRWMRMFNEHIFETSFAVASHSTELLESLRRRRPS